ncbi:MAG: response regulator transcription factor [Opitutae bacterium]|nr:response regulator transcription factor [Opitutae bacterium]
MKAAPTVSDPAARRKIFIVDDHPLVREWLASVIGRETDLEICGQADSAATALQNLPAARPDAIVVDLSLGASSGLELIKDLRLQFSGLLILVLSMHEEVTFAERAFRAGAHGYVVKRESGSRVIEALRAVLAGQFYTSPALASQIAGRLFGAGGRAVGSPSELLSDREMEVFQQRGAGRSVKEIAEFLHVSVKTVESYEARIKEKLGLKNAAELIRAAVRWNDRQHGV